MRKLFLLGLVISLAPFAFIACGNSDQKTDNGSGKMQDPEYAGLGEWAVKVDGHSVVPSVKVQGVEKSEESFVFVKVDITARNIMDKDRNFMLGMLSPELDDGKGNKSQYELFVDGALDRADCKAGMTVSGSVYFKMPGDTGLATKGMKLTLIYLGQMEQPKAEIILK